MFRDYNYGQEDGNELPEGHHKGENIFYYLLGNYEFQSISDYNNYQKQMYMRFFKCVKNRKLEILMVAEKPAMAEELAKNLSNNKYNKRRYFEVLGLDPSRGALEDYRRIIGLDPSLSALEDYRRRHSIYPPCTQIFEFEYNFYGFNSHVWMVATSGHIFAHSFEKKLTNPEQAFFNKIVDVQKNLSNHNLKRFPSLLKAIAKDADAVVLLLDNDLEGEAIGFEVIDIVKDVIKVPEGGTVMDVIYRAAVSSAEEVNNAMQRLKRPDFRKFSAMTAQHILDLLYSAFTRHQKRVLRAKFRDRNIDDLPFGPCQTVALALVVEKYKIKQRHIPKFCVKASIKVNGKQITLTNSQEFADRQSAEELCQKLKASEYCEVIVEPVSVKQSVEPRPEAVMKGIDKGDHPPILPTFNCPKQINRMLPNDALVYSYICCRFLASFMPEYTYFKETTVFEIEDCKFEYSCFKSGEAGFTKALPKLKVKTVKEDLSPNFIFGNKFACDIKVKEIPSPECLRQHELIKALEESNVGTDGTVPTHISTLEKTAYVEVDEKTLEIRPTLLGINLVESYQSAIPEIINPNYRAEFIQDIAGIANGENSFVEVFDRNLKEIWRNFKKFAANFDPSEIDLDKFEPCFKPRESVASENMESDDFWD
uniref:DNA topoisomerase n=1 Tax=Panagrolaimus sp. ES5 TaxID=591445 RepID=A0AC34F038_9BILA